jgi:hypothetical protein
MASNNPLQDAFKAARIKRGWQAEETVEATTVETKSEKADDTILCPHCGGIVARPERWQTSEEARETGANDPDNQGDRPDASTTLMRLITAIDQRK